MQLWAAHLLQRCRATFGVRRYKMNSHQPLENMCSTPRSEELTYTGKSCIILSVAQSQLLDIMMQKHVYGLARRSRVTQAMAISGWDCILVYKIPN